MRCVNEVSIELEEQMGEECLVIKVIGNAFLHSMVRTHRWHSRSGGRWAS